MKLHHVRIVTQDVAALAAFYRELTGVEPVGNEAYLQFPLPGGTLALSCQRVIDLHGAGAAAAGANRSAILDFQVDDVDRERVRLNGLVLRWVMEPKDLPWGSRAMLFRDPDGNLINVFAPVPAAVG